MSFTKITAEDLVNKGVTSLPDTPDMAASELKQRFDSLGNLCVQRINNLVDELENETASLSLGLSMPRGLEADAKKIQDIINALNLIVQQNASERHHHSNMDVLNTITAQDKTKYDQTALKLNGVSIEAIVHDSDTEIPTSGAVVDYVNARIAEALGG